ncbi:MAG: sigma-70 family RNA polymerase sigma factor [Bacteroidota bacterium]
MRQLKIQQHFTNRNSSTLDRYLNEINKEKLLSPDEEAELAKRVKKGDNEAVQTLIKANLRFVVSVAKQYQNQGLSLPDLINEGNHGLIKAVSRFDDTRGFKFISYAVWWIRQSIMLALNEHSRIVRLPMNKIASIKKIQKKYKELEQEYQREPTIEEASEGIQEQPGVIEDVLKISDGLVSMDAPLYEEGKVINMYDKIHNEDSLSPDSNMIDISLRQKIESSFAALDEREGNILRYCFGLNGQAAHSFIEIGNKMGLTPERIRQLKIRAIKKLRNQSGIKLLKTYL